MLTIDQAKANKGKMLHVEAAIGVNIRYAPGTASSIFEKLPQGAYAGKVEDASTQPDGTWYIIAAEGTKPRRSVRTDLVAVRAFTSSAPPASSASPPAPATGPYILKANALKGREVIALPAIGVNVRSGAGTTFSVLFAVPKGLVVGKVIGYVTGTDGWIWLVLRPVVESPVANRFVRVDLVDAPAQAAQPAGQTASQATATAASNDGTALVKDLVATDYKLYHNLLFIGENIAQLRAKGVNTTGFSADFDKLLKQWAARRDKLARNQYITEIKDGFDKSYIWIKSKWDALVSAVVTLSVGAIVGVAFVGGIAASIVLYQLFKPDYDTSKKNLKESDDLKKLLAQADPATAAKIRKQLEGQIDDTYNTGKTDQAGTSMVDNLITMAKVGLGVFVGAKVISLIKR